MDRFPEDIKFKYPWRPYQERVLKELELHLDDERLHVVAPPGSGKTVLGLEVVRRLNQPTLILAPTITVRDQWADRFAELFLNSNGRHPRWLSMDLGQPGFMTVTTYQALHAKYSVVDNNSGQNPQEEKYLKSAPLKVQVESSLASRDTDFFKLLRSAGFKTVVVDEAHHLKNEWWKSLMATIQSLEGATLVALTATPPYDVSYQEWQRYKALCGVVDAEITVPELVLEKNLCVHQDYVHFSAPTPDEAEQIRAFRRDVDDFVQDFLVDPDFIPSLYTHPWLVSPHAMVENILDNPEYFSSMLVVLNHLDYDVPHECLEILSLSREQLPPFDYDWLEILLTNALFRDAGSFVEIKPVIQEMSRRLKRIHAAEAKKVRLTSTSRIAKSLMSSAAKFESIVEIVELERRGLGDRLRMVILADYIRRSDLPKFGEEEKPLLSLGVAPIFECLRREFMIDLRVGILSGSFVVIPESAKVDLELTAVTLGLELSHLKLQPLQHDPGYLEVKVAGASQQSVVKLITEMMAGGALHVLVGTKSLLGEGWDAPFVNVLVLATFVGSYVLSNQMRGRAIRALLNDPQKTANIWHLVCVELGVNRLGDDLQILSRRFKAFIGVSQTSAFIENGIRRLGIASPPFSRNSIAAMNSDTAARASDRNGLRSVWEKALLQGDAGVRLVEQLKTPMQAVPWGISVDRLTYVFIRHMLLITAFGWMLITRSSNLAKFGNLSEALLLVLGLASLVLLPKTFKLGWLAARHGASVNSMRDVSRVLLRSLYRDGFVKTNIKSLTAVTAKGPDGAIFCNLEGATPYEKILFLDCLQELLGPIDNQRYLIVRTNVLWGRKKQYFGLPQILAQKKKSAEFFSSAWREEVGPAELVYTRNIAGRRDLIAARARSLCADIKETERISRWK